MLAYHFRLGLRSLRRNPFLTVLMVITIGIGVASSMTTYAVFRATSKNPIPAKSSRLFIPQIDSWGQTASAGDDGEPPDMMNYTDAMALMRDRRARFQTAMYPIDVSVMPTPQSRLPLQVSTYATYAGTFPMFDIPFLFGSAWSSADDQAHAEVAVISRSLNNTLFGGENSVGKALVLNHHTYRIVGVRDSWNPQPLFYDVKMLGAFGEAAQVFIPFTTAIDARIPTAGANLCKTSSDSGWDTWLASDCTWIWFWVELPDEKSVAGYRSYLDGYAAEQKRAGRFHWAPNTRLRDVMQWLDYKQVVPAESRISLLISLGFLIICLVNTVGLLLAKFMRRGPEIAVRRALGAPRKAIHEQFLIEAGMVGLAGGMLGLVLTGAGMTGIGLVFEPAIARLATWDVSLVALTVAAAVLATVLAAIYPAWRAASVKPTW
ncbi:peptide ABC transporter permease [Luteibacter rhizovicinus DSM 16549]|uniref:Peptide ABC transporter permease n=1 Tax=Luteibacter rhizovicinus DSM 16549 TaxID=1440763 RepID=A0A0G9HCY3_9GAMM|nr:ABC transporter permease [Luteibacter rhizovicinus]APG05537.1 peptide ABC transporter permease [Luteibacter rhizovicinus DSM 16549]KLD67069.1 peptide ABC transporter permease [Luteibacter rhizovicinus DSM 16549]